MTETITNEAPAKAEVGLVATAAQGAMGKAGEHIGESAINWVLNKVKEKYGRAMILTGATFKRYLENAYNRYNQVKTLVTGIEPRTIIGQDSIYLEVGVEYKNKEYDTSTVDSLLKIKRNLLICGSGGAGKSMLMRYLFLNTVNRGEYIPVLLELRKISENSSSERTLMDLIYKCMEDFDTELPREEFEYSLRLGKYVFFLDGFDEIKSSLADNAAEAIQKFAAKYPQNAYIMTSRPDRNFVPLETFTQLQTMNLTKIQAVSLSQKFWEKDEKVIEFCKQLDETLYDQHKDFAQNPLLLSMMFLTFMSFGSIPDHRADFYEKCYAALYNMHDNRNKGTYKREFECKNLDEHKFKLLFARFCFRTYIDDDFEFSYKAIINMLDKCIQKLGIVGITPKQYLNDLVKVVCLIVREGDTYRFSHRSFQAYFAAVYVATLPDEQQKLLFKTLIKDFWIRLREIDFLPYLYQLIPNRFILNAFEDVFRSISKKSNNSDDAEHIVLAIICDVSISFFRREDNSISVGGIENFPHTSESGAIHLFSQLIISPVWSEKYISSLFSAGQLLAEQMDESLFCEDEFVKIRLRNLESIPWLTDVVRNQFIENLKSSLQIQKIVESIRRVLQQIDESRAVLHSSHSIFDEL